MAHLPHIAARPLQATALRAIDSAQTAPQVEELKQRIRTLHAVGFSALEEADEGADDQSSRSRSQNPDAAGGALGGVGSAPLETLLLEKNRQLEHALTMARLQLSEASGDSSLNVSPV